MLAGRHEEAALETGRRLPTWWNPMRVYDLAEPFEKGARIDGIRRQKWKSSSGLLVQATASFCTRHFIRDICV